MYERNSQEQMKRLIESFRENLEELNGFHKADGTWGSKENAKTYSLTKRAKKHLAKDSEVEIGRGRVTKNGKVAAKFGMNGSDPDKACGRLTFDGDKKKKTRSCKDYPNNYKEGLFVEPPGTLETSPKTPPIDSPSKTSKARKGPIRVRIHKRKQELDETEEDRARPESKKRKQEKILPGYGDLKSLARGITENQEIELSLESLVAALKTFLEENPSSRTRVEKELKTIGFYSGSTFREKARAIGLYSLEDWTKIQNSQALASKGELYKKQSK